MSDEDHQRLLDQSRLLIRRGKRQQEQSGERIERGKHRWLQLRAGRVCEDCRTAQMRDEYDDDVECVG